MSVNEQDYNSGVKLPPNFGKDGQDIDIEGMFGAMAVWKLKVENAQLRKCIRVIEQFLKYGDVRWWNCHECSRKKQELIDFWWDKRKLTGRLECGHIFLFSEYTTRSDHDL